MARNTHLKKLYQWRAGHRTGGVAAQAAGEELARIAKRDGNVSPQVLVQESAPESAPLHPAFDWQDEVAAGNWRLHQARNLIRAVQVVSSPGEPPRPVYVNVPTASAGTTGPGYYPVEVVAKRPDMYAQALGELLQRVASAERAAAALKEAAASAPDTDQERMARISIAVEAMRTAHSAVAALQ